MTTGPTTPSPARGTAQPVDRLWATALALGVLLPVAGVVGAAVTGVTLLLLPAFVVGAAVALGLGVLV